MKKNWKRVVCLGVAIAMLSLLLSACSSNTPSNNSAAPGGTSSEPAADDGTVYTMKLGGQWADSSVHSKMFTEVFIPQVEERSGGRIKCEWYGNNALGNEMDQLTQLQMGQLHLATLSDQSATIDPAHMFLPYLPFLFESEEHWDTVVDGELGEQMVANMPNSGIRCLGFDENGYRVVTNNVRPINNAADMQGLKMRVTSSDMYIALFSALGSSCQAMTLGEAYSALETGACDGQDNAYNTILSSGLYEVQKYMANTNHVLGTLYVCVSESWYQSLPADLQDVVSQCVKDACQWERETYRSQAEADRQALLDNGLEETNPDIESFKAATASVYDDFVAKYPEVADLVAAIQAAA